ncbi:MAG: alpha/beta hydrolase [Patescibacteria group bacterium]
MDINKKTIICLPGLGGHESVFYEYQKFFNGHGMHFLQIINEEKSFKEITEICGERAGNIVFLTNCYGAQLAIRLINSLPWNQDKISGLIIIEPFFSEFHHWRRPARTINKLILLALSAADKIGFKRKWYRKNVDYNELARYPLFFQPIFDMQWQNLDDYFKKILSLLYFQLPKQKINVPTLLIFSPKGFMQNKGRRKIVSDFFQNSSIEEIQTKSHNIITLAKDEIGDMINSWLSRLTYKI